MRDLLKDLRYGIRGILRSPGLAVTAALSLALGIGATTALFSVTDQVLLRMLPVRDPARLVQLSPTGFFSGASVGMNPLSYPMYRDLRDRNQVFDGLLCRYRFAASLGNRGETDRITAEMVSGNYFQLLGVKAAIGRTITLEDDRKPGAHPVAVLSYDGWMNRFGGDRGVIGQVIRINGRPMTIIGVSERGFDGVELGFSPQVRLPIMMTAGMISLPEIALERQMTRWVQVFGRLKPGVTTQQAAAALRPLYYSITEATIRSGGLEGQPERNKGRFLASSIEVLPGGQGTSFLRRMMSTALWALMAMAGVMLLMTCVNVANLLVGRGVQRQPELAIRMAIGAGRARIVRQLLSESALLAVFGGGAGVLLAAWTTPLLVRLIPTPEGSLRLPAEADWRILGFSLAVSAGAALLFGLAPALLATQVELSPVLKRQSAAGAGRGRFRRSLVASQIGLSLLLLIGAALFLRSIRNLTTIDPGFQTTNMVAFTVDPSLNGYPRQQSMDAFGRLKQRLETMSGADSAALGMERLLDGDVWNTFVVVEGYRPQPGEDPIPYFNAVSEDYFKTLRIPILEGREFLPSDGAGTPLVAIVNQKFAEYFFGKRSAIGRHVRYAGGGRDLTDTRIVGVVKDSKYEGVREETPRQVFVPYRQTAFTVGMSGYVRSSLPSESVFASIRRVVRDVDPNLPIGAMRTLDDQRDRSLANERLVAILATLFGALATLLAAIGLYGVLTFSVARRTRELGLRVALGARAASVVWLVLKEVLLLWVAGAGVALPVALVLGRFVKTQLYGIAPGDPWTIAAATLLLALVAALAAAVPALRATRIAPTVALRYE
jgi:predicted permease